MEEDIRLLDVYQILKKHARTIFLTTIGCIIFTTFLLLFVIQPQYTSQAQLLVGNDNFQQELIKEETDRTIDRNISMINTYTDILRGTSVLADAAGRLNDAYTVEEIQSAIQIEHSFNSQLFSITATMTDPQEAQNVVNAVEDAFIDRVYEIYGADNSLVHTISDASYSPNKVSPNEVFITLLGLMFGLSIGVLMAIGLELKESGVIDEEFFVSINVVQLGKIFDMDEEELGKKVKKH